MGFSYEFKSISLDTISKIQPFPFGFLPQWMDSRTVFEDGEWWQETRWEELLDKNETGELSVYDNHIEEHKQSFAYIPFSYREQKTLKWHIYDFNFIYGFIEDLILQNDGFVNGYIADLSDMVLQSEIYESNCKLFNQWPETPLQFKTDKYLGRIIDVSKHYGRYEMAGDTFLIAAPIMWFGKGYYKYVPKERLLSFPGAEELMELPNGVVYIKLFDPHLNHATPEIRLKQKQFREWIDMDGLEKKLDGDDDQPPFISTIVIEE